MYGFLIEVLGSVCYVYNEWKYSRSEKELAPGTLVLPRTEPESININTYINI